MKRLNQSGIAHLGILLGLVVVAAIAFAGYRVMSQQSDNLTAETSASATVPAAIKTKSDLSQTGKALDQTSADLNNNLDSSSLDSDINSML